jgi:hypothetical protein
VSGFRLQRSDCTVCSRSSATWPTTQSYSLIGPDWTTRLDWLCVAHGTSGTGPSMSDSGCRDLGVLPGVVLGRKSAVDAVTGPRSAYLCLQQVRVAQNQLANLVSSDGSDLLDMTRT